MKSNPSSTRPNILWICTDSQRWDTLGCMGNRFVRTPNIDRLAQSGVLFENAFSQSPLCMPSRGSFLTGRYPSTNRLRQNGQETPQGLLPITKVLADEGYDCGLVGKLHLSNCDQRLTLGPEWWRHKPEEWIVPQEKRIADGYRIFDWDHAPNGENPNSAYTQWLAAHGIKAPLEKRGHLLSSHVRMGYPIERHQTTWCAEKAVEFIKSHAGTNSNTPWLFSANIFDPHPDYNPPEAYLERYLKMLEEIPLPAFTPEELENKPGYHREKYESGKGHSTCGWSEQDLRMIRAGYWAMCDLIDAKVGLILDALRDSGQESNTLVIFTSDHGELLGDHGQTVKGPYLYEGSVHVPLIISWPGTIAGGRRATGLVELTDLAPTLLDAIGLPCESGMQGKSLWPQLTGTASVDAIRPDVYAEYYNANPDKPAHWMNMLRTDRYKIIALHETLEGELYDLAEDPEETRNLWSDPAYTDIKWNLFQRLAARMAFTTDPLPKRVGVF